MPEDFTTLAANAAAMNAEEAFDRCMEHIRTDEPLNQYGLSKFMRRAEKIRGNGFDLEVQARINCEQAIEALMSQEEYDALQEARTQRRLNNIAALASQKYSRSMEAVRTYPNHNADPFSVRSARGEFGIKVE